MRRWIPILLFAGALALVHSEARPATLQWVIPKSERLEMVRTARVEFLVNNATQKIYDERNIINLTCEETGENFSRVKGLFTVYQKNPGKEMFEKQEEYPSDFVIQSTGRFEVDKKLYMPNLRHLPTFPAKDLKKGDTWTAPCELLINSFSVPLNLRFDPEYQIREITQKDGKEIAVIEYRYQINREIAGPGIPADMPRKIMGQNRGVILWDVAGRRPEREKDNYRIVFLFRDSFGSVGTTEFRMLMDTTYSTFAPVKKDEQEKAKKDLEKQIPEGSGISVESDKRGLVLRLGEVFFDFDSYRLRDDTVKNLDAVGTILKSRYPDREIQVEGHTDIVGPRDYNKALSENRAHEVARYLRERTGNDKLSYRGHGSDRPIAENNTEEGRQKNRRVEIIIKMN